VKNGIVIAGSGFSGMWSAISAARAVSLAGRENDVNITMVSPSPNLHIRPRFYETAFDEMTPDIAPLLAAVGVKHLCGTVELIDTRKDNVVFKNSDGVSSALSYDRFILATGSQLYLPEIPGLKEHSFNVDQLHDAVTLDNHLRRLADLESTVARNTVVVIGGGFTGIETALEIPQRLRTIFGNNQKTRVVVIEQSSEIGPTLGAGPRPLIQEAFTECGVEIMSSTEVKSISSDGLITDAGVSVPSNTVIWKSVYVTGDVAMVAADDKGNIAAMSCQHALSLGRVSGHNAAAELVGLPMHPYSQSKYVTCLDLGTWGAVYTEGWGREVCMERKEAKELKQTINTQWIYPPEADRDAAFAVAAPDYVIVP
jgi:NADH dehydrogenase